MSQNDDNNDDTRKALFLIFALVALVVTSVVGFGAYKALSAKSKSSVAASVPVAAASPAVAALAPAAAADTNVPRVVVESGVVKFYFAPGKAGLASGAAAALVDVAKGVAGGKKAVVSGFTDATGDPVKNAKLAKERAFAVRDALVAAGVKLDAVELRKPGATTANATGSSADARRVDVTLE